jgi:plasmid stabilization system protein ParE
LLRDIESAARRAGERPTAWRAHAELGPEIRSIPVRPYRIFFQVAWKDIEIVRVLHERRDLGAVFAGNRKP